MSQRHQASRRRTYGRREHEIHERTERPVGALDWIEKAELPWPEDRWTGSLIRPWAGDWLSPRGTD
jgi:hypothetical protein